VTLATTSDLLRLLVVPVFGWAAVRDLRTRRVPNRTWLPLAAFGVGLLAWDAWLVVSGGTLLYQSPEAFALRVAISLGFVVPFAYAFWWIGGFGGADAKALMILALLFPTYPHYLLPGTTLPVVESTIGVFSMTILSNTVIVGVVYPLGLAVRNALSGEFGRLMFVGRSEPVEHLPERYGRLLERPDGYTRSGMDLDVLRMYLAWRACSLSALRAAPDRFRDPDSLPEETGDPGDGTVATDGGHESESETDTRAWAENPDGIEPAESDSTVDGRVDHDDLWGAAAFFEEIGGPIYGTDAEDLREGLEVLARNDTAWYSPGIPFIVPMFVGLLVALVAGDVLIWLLGQLG